MSRPRKPGNRGFAVALTRVAEGPGSADSRCGGRAGQAQPGGLRGHVQGTWPRRVEFQLARIAEAVEDRQAQRHVARLVDQLGARVRSSARPRGRSARVVGTAGGEEAARADRLCRPRLRDRLSSRRAAFRRSRRRRGARGHDAARWRGPKLTARRARRSLARDRAARDDADCGAPPPAMRIARRSAASSTAGCGSGAALRGLALRGARIKDLYRASFDGKRPQVTVGANGEVDVQYKGFSWFGARDVASQMTLTTAVPWSVEIRRGVSHLTADLRELQISSIEITGGASESELALLRPRGSSTLRLSGGASRLVIRRPRGTAVQISVRGGASHLVFDAQRLGAVGGPTRLSTPGWDAAPDRWSIEVRGGASDLSVIEDQRLAAAAMPVGLAASPPATYWWSALPGGAAVGATGRRSRVVGSWPVFWPGRVRRKEELVTALDEDLVARRIRSRRLRTLAPGVAESSARRRTPGLESRSSAKVTNSAPRASVDRNRGRRPRPIAPAVGCKRAEATPSQLPSPASGFTSCFFHQGRGPGHRLDLDRGLRLRPGRREKRCLLLFRRRCRSPGCDRAAGAREGTGRGASAFHYLRCIRSSSGVSAYDADFAETRAPATTGTQRAEQALLRVRIGPRRRRAG